VPPYSVHAASVVTGDESGHTVTMGTTTVDTLFDSMSVWLAGVHTLLGYNSLKQGSVLR